MVIYDQDIPPILYKFSDVLRLFSLVPLITVNYIICPLISRSPISLRL